MTTTHVMLDIETLGTRPGATILSAALVRFSDEAHCTVNFDTAEQHAALGSYSDPETVEWWRQQDPLAWQMATQNPAPVRTGLAYLSDWIAWAGADPLIWCHGATFDAPLLDDLYRRAGVSCPWRFWSVRDTRTLYDLASVNVKDYAVPPPHVALNDAIGQVRAANAALRVLAKAHAA